MKSYRAIILALAAAVAAGLLAGCGGQRPGGGWLAQPGAG
jgi:hypothetical protein